MVTVIPEMEREKSNYCWPPLTIIRIGDFARYIPSRRGGNIYTTNRIEPNQRACIREIQFNLYRSANDITNLINKCRRVVYLYTACGVTGHRDKRNVTVVRLLRRVCACACVSV